MNLFYSPTLSELYQLIEGREPIATCYNIIVDNDGEVLFEEHSYIPESKLTKFRFYLNGIGPGCDQEPNKVKSLKFLNQLYKNLLFCWEKGMTGKIDFNSVSKLQNMFYHKEINSIRKNDYPISINTYR